MYIIQLAIILFSLLFSCFLVLKLLSRFKRKDIAPYFLMPLIAYAIGFSLRLSEKQDFIDIGYFFTEGSFLVVYIFFSIAIVLGQFKYWKK